jgi:purine-cytosine permease-like protein
LFAELLVDGVLSYTLYRHLHKVETHFWLSTAFKRTVIPFLLTAIFLAILGAAMAHYAPGARSIGEVIHYSGGKH